MAFNMFITLLLCCFFTNSLTAPHTSLDNIDKNDESADISTVSSLEKTDQLQHPWWDVEEDDDEFGLNGNVWLQEPSSPSESTWDQSSPNLKEVSLENGDFVDQNFIPESESDDDDDDEDDEEMDSLSLKQNGSQQDLTYLSSEDEQKRDDISQLKVRHAGRNPLPSSAFIINQKLGDDENDDESDDDDDALENYDAVLDSENDGEEDIDSENNDMFQDENEMESKRLFEDKVFLF